MFFYSSQEIRDMDFTISEIARPAPVWASHILCYSTSFTCFHLTSTHPVQQSILAVRVCEMVERFSCKASRLDKGCHPSQHAVILDLAPPAVSVGR